MRLHDYAASGDCHKVRLLLALLDVPYERVPVDIFAGDTLTDAFGALNPLRETPVLELDDGTAITQSPAILTFLGARLAERAFLLGDRATIADVAVYAYASRAGDIGLPPEAWPAFAAWVERVRALPRFVDDFEPYPANARQGAGRSIYDS